MSEGRKAGIQPLALLLVTILTVCVVGSEDEEPLVTDRPDITDSSTTVGHLRFQAEFGFL